MDIFDEIVAAAEKSAEYYKQHFCNDVCQKVMVVPKSTTQQLVKLRCQSCKEMVNYVTSEVVTLMENTDWNFIYGPKKMSMQQAISYIMRERQQFESSAKAIAEYAGDDCEKEWGITGRFNTALTIDQYKNPIITGLNEFFEEENVRRREYMTREVAPPDVLGKEAKRCKKAARLLIVRMLADIHKRVPRFDFNFHY